MAHVVNIDGGGAGAAETSPNSAVTSAMTSVAMAYLSSWRQERMKSWRPFGEFLNSKRVSMPSGVGGVKDRIFKNVPYFLTNYLMVLVVLTLLTLLMAPMMAVLISMPLLVYWYLFVWRADLQYTVPVIGYAVGDREKYVAVGLVAALVFLFAASDLIWLVGLTVVFVGVHSVCYATQDEWEIATAFDADPV